MAKGCKKMNIGILTHHTVINQGAIMQMYSLKSWLEKNGHNVSILTYTKDFDFEPSERKRYNISISSIPFFLKEYLIKKGLGLTWFNVKKQILYKKYISQNFSFKSYATDNTDAVIVGSDEVFSLATGCNMMMYGHGVNTNHLISYAPSFGQTDMARIEKFHCKELIASGLSKFDALSVRDVNSAKIIKELIGVDPTVVCDPVMLYDFTNEHTNIDRFHLDGKKYMLVYSMDRWMREPDEINAIKKYAEKKGYITVSAGTFHKWCDKNILCNPMEWLEIFRNAQEVITDTFHGSVLSIITNRPSFYYIRNLNSNKLMSLYKYFGLEDRILDKIDYENMEKIQNSSITDFQAVNEKLLKLRKHSEKYLIESLSYAEREIKREII